jgi:hypothetical protein
MSTTPKLGRIIMKTAKFIPITVVLSLAFLVAGAFLVSESTPRVFGQNYRPAAELQSLLNMRFYENNGGFLVENVQVVFPPAGSPRGMLVVSRASGEEVASMPLRLTRYSEFPAFANFVPDGDPGNLRIGQTGDYVMTIKIGGDEVTRMPFSLKEERNNDPFNPKTQFIREGPWRDWAYIASPVDEPGGNITFNFWMSLREFPAGGNRPMASLHLMLGAQQVGTTRSNIVPSYVDWQFFSKELVTAPNVPSPHYLTMADLKKDGDYTMVLKVNGQSVKSYKFQVKGGQLIRPEQSRLGYEPQVNFMSPRFVDISEGTSSRYKMRDMYWVKKIGR